MKDGVYYRHQAARVKAILAREKTQALVAVVEGVSEVAGWVCFEPGDPVVVHWLFVFPLYRKLGIGRRLLLLTGWNGGTIVATHQPRFIKNGPTLGMDIQYNPFLLEEP